MSATDSLDGPRLGSFISALIDAYPSYDHLEMLLTIQLSKSFADIAGTGALRLCAFKLVKAAMSGGWLPDLITAAIAEQPGNAKLRAWIESEGWVEGLDVIAASPTSLPAYELVKSMNFDLAELHREIIRAVREPVSPVLGFATRYPEDVFLRNLCDWLESYVNNAKRKDALNLLPTIGPVSERLRALAQYKPDLDSANVVCMVYTQGVPAEIVMDFWRGVHHEFAGINGLLLLVFASDTAATLPEDMIELPLPHFEEEDIYIWTVDMVRMHGWPLGLANAWTELLCREAIHDDVINVRRLYLAMDRTIEEVRYQNDDFRTRLERLSRNADAP
jgi:Effector-associated domain 1